MQRRDFVMTGAALAAIGLAPGAGRAAAEATLPPGLSFRSIDGGTIALDDWRGRPILIANTASLCAFAPQYTGLQELYDRYRDAGLIVLAVPSDDFRQELGSDAEVREYCEMVFGIDMPMTTITSVRGDGAHPLFLWLAEAHGFVPGWNFNKVLIGGDGRLLGTWGSNAAPTGGAITRAVEGALGL